jgi:hypothetical protein
MAFLRAGILEKLERIQKRALRLILRDPDSSYETLLEKANLPSLHLRRLRLIACETFKAVNLIGPSYISNLFRTINSGHATRGLTGKNLSIPQVRTTGFGKQTFSFLGASLWNNLPPDMRNALSLSTFKNHINTWSGPGCLCAMCRR